MSLPQITVKGPTHFVNLRENLRQVDRLLEIHEDVTGPGPGYKHNVQVLNKSAVVLLVAAWEAFIEDLATAAFFQILGNTKDHHVFPGKVLAIVSEELLKDHDLRRIWELAGKNWKNVLKLHKDKVIEEFAGSLNTPRQGNVDKLFESLIGLPNISSNWHWPRTSVKDASSRLSQLITIRGSIAHRVATSKTVSKQYVEHHITFIRRLAVMSHNAVREHIGKRVGFTPWKPFKLAK